MDTFLVRVCTYNLWQDLFTWTSIPETSALQTLYPPVHSCTFGDTCSWSKWKLLLTKAEQGEAIIYTLNDGAVPAYHIHLKCEGVFKPHLSLLCTKLLRGTTLECHINYHHNYSVSGSSTIPYTCTYYDGIPAILQVGEHQFVERKVIDLWISLMLISWFSTPHLCYGLCKTLNFYLRTSATNCAHLYNTSLAQEHEKPAHWSFGFKLTSNHVWDAFVILSLLEDSVATVITDVFRKNRINV